MRSVTHCALLLLMTPFAGCVDEDCATFNGDQYEFYHGDRCPGLINNGALRLYPSSLVLPPSLAGVDAASGIESSAVVSVRGWHDAGMTVPASGYVVDVILGSCGSPDVAPVEPATLRLELTAVAAEVQSCTRTNDLTARCLLDTNGQASVRVVAGGTLSPIAEDLCLWARSGLRDHAEPSTSTSTGAEEETQGMATSEGKPPPDPESAPGKVPSQERMSVRVGYRLEDLELAFEPRLATPLGCGGVELPCLPLETPVLPNAVCTDGAKCADLVQSVQLGIATQYHDIPQASGQELRVLMSLTSFGADGRVWLADSADCAGSAATLEVVVHGAEGRSSDVWVCADGLGGDVSVRAQSLQTPALADMTYARFTRIPAAVSAVSVVESDIEAENAVYRLFVRDCAAQGLPGISVRGSLDGGQTFSALCITDEVGACLLAMPKEMGTLPDALLARIDAWKTECALDIL